MDQGKLLHILATSELTDMFVFSSPYQEWGWTTGQFTHNYTLFPHFSDKHHIFMNTTIYSDEMSSCFLVVTLCAKCMNVFAQLLAGCYEYI